MTCTNCANLIYGQYLCYIDIYIYNDHAILSLTRWLLVLKVLAFFKLDNFAVLLIRAIFAVFELITSKQNLFIQCYFSDDLPFIHVNIRAIIAHEHRVIKYR